LTFEVHLLDFSGNLKGMMLNTFFVEESGTSSNLQVLRN